MEGIRRDAGETFDAARGFGWDRDQRPNTRKRGVFGESLRDAFAFTRDQATWECVVPNGRHRVTVSLGDAAYPQPGQSLVIEGERVIERLETSAGRFHEATVVVDVHDGRLTVRLGPQEPGTNTTLDWIRIVAIPPERPR